MICQDISMGFTGSATFKVLRCSSSLRFLEVSLVSTSVFGSLNATWMTLHYITYSKKIRKLCPKPVDRSTNVKQCQDHNWLVAWNDLKNISQIGWSTQVGVKIKNVWNHHLDKDWNIQLWGCLVWHDATCCTLWIDHTFQLVGKWHVQMDETAAYSHITAKDKTKTEATLQKWGNDMLRTRNLSHFMKYLPLCACHVTTRSWWSR